MSARLNNIMMVPSHKKKISYNNQHSGNNAIGIHTS